MISFLAHFWFLFRKVFRLIDHLLLFRFWNQTEHLNTGLTFIMRNNNEPWLCSGSPGSHAGYQPVCGHWVASLLWPGHRRYCEQAALHSCLWAWGRRAAGPNLLLLKQEFSSSTLTTRCTANLSTITSLVLLTSTAAHALCQGRGQGEGAGLRASWCRQVTHEETRKKLSSGGGLGRGGRTQSHGFRSHWRTKTWSTLFN